MGTKLDDRPDEDNIQRHYDDEFDALTSAEHQARDGTSGDIGEEEKGFFRNENANDPETNAAEASGVTQDAASKPESADESGFYNEENQKSNQPAGSTAKGGGVRDAAQVATGNPLAMAKLASNFFWGSKKRKRNTFGGGIFAGTIILIITTIISLVPLKIVSTIQNIENRAKASAMQALTVQGDMLFKDYLTEFVLEGKGKGKCRATSDVNCVSTITGQGPVAQLYKGWRKDKLTEKLAKGPNGITFGYSRSTKTYYINTAADGRRFDFDNEADLEKLLTDPNTTVGSRKEIRRIYHANLADRTLAEQVYMRFRYSRTINREAGDAACFLICTPGRALHDATIGKLGLDEKRLAAKAYVIQNVLTPLGDEYGFMLQCALLGGGAGCNATQIRNASPGAANAETDTASRLRSNLQKYAKTLPVGKDDARLKSAVTRAKVLGEKGLSRFIINEVLIKLIVAGGTDAVEATTKAAEIGAKAIDPFTWVLVIAQISETIEQIGPTLKYIGYAANAMAAAKLFHQYQVVADETKTGDGDAAEIGSYANSLSTSLATSETSSVSDANKTLKDSDASASDFTDTPYYKSTSGSGSQTALLSGFGGTAFAADSSNSSNYVCDDGKPVPKGELVCPEENLAGGTGVTNFTNAISKGYSAMIDSNPQIKGPLDIFNAINGLIGGLSSFVVDAVLSPVKKTCDIPKVGDACKAGLSAISALAQPILDLFMKVVVHSPFNKLSGGRIGDMLNAGAFVTYGKSAQEDLGAKQVDDATDAQNTQAYLDEQRSDFQAKPLFARMFSTDTPYSFVSRLAMALPGNVTATGTNMASTFASNPFSAITRTFSTMLSPLSASADGSAAGGNPFGVPNAGYPTADIPKNPTKFWDDNCVTGPLGWWDESQPVGQQLDISQWLNEKNHIGQVGPGSDPGEANDNFKNVKLDEDTGQTLFKNTNACLLILASLQSLGGMSDPTLLPNLNDDASQSNSGDGTSFKLATFNVLHSDGQSDATWQARMNRSLKVLEGNNDVGVVGFQEMRENQQGYFKQIASDTYDMWPTNTSRKNDADPQNSFTPNPIAWDKNRFQMVSGSGKKQTIKYGGDGALDYLTQITLQDKESGQQFLVLNTHDPADVRGGDAAQDRFDNANHYANDIIPQLKQQGLPIFFTGDFNNRYSVTSGGGNQPLGGQRANLTYCILTKNGNLFDSYDASYNTAHPKNLKSGACPSTSASPAGNPVDHIFMSSDASISISNFDVIGQSGQSSNGSDHDTIAVDVSIGATEAGETSDDTQSKEGWQWPISLSDYTGLSSCWNTTISINGTTGHHAGQDIQAGTGTKVYAAHDGTVVSAKFNSAGGNTLLIDAKNGTWYNYQHLTSYKVKAGDTVKAGQLVAISGATGANVTGPHLHFGVAVSATTGSLSDNSQTRNPLDYVPADRSEAGCR